MDCVQQGRVCSFHTPLPLAPRSRVTNFASLRHHSTTRFRPSCAKPHARPICLATAAPASVQAEDKWVNAALEALSGGNNHRPIPAVLQQVQHSCREAARTMRMPSTRNEEYRFTDISPLLQKQLQGATAPSDDVIAAAAAQLEAHSVEGAARLVLVDGVVCPQLSSNLEKLRGGVYLGGLADAPPAAVATLGQQAGSRGGPFAVLNGALAEDAAVLVVPDSTQVDTPVHVVYVATGAPGAASTLSSCAPRLLCVVGKSARVALYEEFVPLTADDAAAFTNSVAEFDLQEDAEVSLGYLQFEGSSTFHLRSTLVSQSASSCFRLCEVSLGGKLTRHDISIHQAGASTTSSMHSFLLCSAGQLHDLHSKLRLNHPRGEAQQLHKCIVTHATGRGVFDGNVRVERLAQQTDAKQLSRNLLLVPKATVTVKPNLQIIADDVKCTHGCTVSDLEEDQLFYFLARGIPKDAARQALVYSFGAEVVQRLDNKGLVQRVERHIKNTLQQASV